MRSYSMDTLKMICAILIIFGIIHFNLVRLYITKIVILLFGG